MGASLAHSFSALAAGTLNSLHGQATTITLGDYTMDTSVPDSQSLAARVERLEKQYHWLKSEVATEKLVLVDADGKTRASLCMPDGVPSLILHDAEGNVRAILRVSADGPSLHLLDSKTRTGLELTVGEDGPDVALFDANGKQRLTLKVNRFESGVPSLSMRDPNGAASVVVSAMEDFPGVCLFDAKNPDGNTSAQITIESDGRPSLLCVKAGKVLWSAP